MSNQFAYFLYSISKYTKNQKMQDRHGVPKNGLNRRFFTFRSCGNALTGYKILHQEKLEIVDL